MTRPLSILSLDLSQIENQQVRPVPGRVGNAGQQSV